jgi:glycine cleavage system aminomethyltransferase T/glycine/D-amino acid oxidase-like deaminating enzyme
MADLPEHKSYIVVGGGIVGVMTAWHLWQRGETDIAIFDKSGIPTDIGSTAHASDFIFNTCHDRMTAFTTGYSREFYKSRGHFLEKGGLEVCLADRDERWEELWRRMGSAKSFGFNMEMLSARDAAALHPFLAEHAIRGALWDKQAGLVVPRSQAFAAEIVDEMAASGAVEIFPHTPVTGLDVEDGRVRGIGTARGRVAADRVILACGIWGETAGRMAGAPVPVAVGEHPLLFFRGPALDEHLEAFDPKTDLCLPLMRIQDLSAYVRDTGGHASTEGGEAEFGYYETHAPRIVAAADIAEPGASALASLSPSMHPLALEQCEEVLLQSLEVVPIFGELEYMWRKSFNGLLLFTPDGASVVGETPEVKDLWLAEAVWVKDGPGIGKLVADWIVDGEPHIDPQVIDVARFYPHQKEQDYVVARSSEIARKVYGIVHPREPYESGRGILRSPFHAREAELGGAFDQADNPGGWERAPWYESNRCLLERYADRIPERPHEWDRRWHSPIAYAEHLAMRDGAGMINLSHFAIFDLLGPKALDVLQRLAVAQMDVAVGRVVYTQFLDHRGGVRADLTVMRLGDAHFRVVTGGAVGSLDKKWILDHLPADGVEFVDLTQSRITIGLWGPMARRVLQSLTDTDLSHEAFPFARATHIQVRDIPVLASRLSYVGELGWELHVGFDHGSALWSALEDAGRPFGVVPVGIETYATSAPLEGRYLLQGAELETEYTLVEAGLAPKRIKEAAFNGKAALVEELANGEPVAALCTMTVDDNLSSDGTPRFIVGDNWPLLDPETGSVLVDAKGRRCRVRRVGYGPSVGEQIVMGYLPREWAQIGVQVMVEYFGEHFPLTVRSTDRTSLFDPDKRRVRQADLSLPPSVPVESEMSLT